ncbi:6-carboxytetrahydropterin synthase QueD [Campylobacterota bacterium]|nr:6-carboxytetrahydropterin synthase QueD [Campylobacterota bacterium]
MIIRKLFRFENAHIVRGSVSGKCARSIHGHSYKAEILLESHTLNDAQMVIDFVHIKELLGALIGMFDHSVAIWKYDAPEYINALKTHSERWIVLGVNPSAEQFARVIFCLAAAALRSENGVCVHSVIIHETDTGYAQAFADDAANAQMGAITPQDFEFSETVISELGGLSRFLALFN